MGLISVAIVVGLSVAVRTTLIDRRQRKLTWLIWRSVRPRHIGFGLATCFVVVAAASVIITYVPFATVSWLSLVGAMFAGGDSTPTQADAPGNLALAPLQYAAANPTVAVAVAVAYVAVIVFVLPRFAFREEVFFRTGSQDRSRGQQWRSALVFGLMHLLMGIPVGAALALTLAGMAWTRLYLSGIRRAEGRSWDPSNPDRAALTVLAASETRSMERAAQALRADAIIDWKVRTLAQHPNVWLPGTDRRDAVAAQTHVSPSDDELAQLPVAHGLLEASAGHLAYNAMLVTLILVAVAASGTAL